MTPTVLFRVDAAVAEEYAAAEAACRDAGVALVTNRARVPPGSLVFGRYAVLPFYAELELDLGDHGSALVNTLEQHRYIASFDYYRDVRALTFPTWRDDEFPRTTDPGPFVVKGATNSRKHDWDTMMFAADRAAAIAVMTRLRADPLIGTQPLVVRKYVPLVTHEVGLNGVRFADEYRFFFLGTREVAAGYYWSEAEDDGHQVPAGARALAAEVAAIVARRVPFFVLDVARTEAGGWILVEVNDAQCSGLSTIPPAPFYENLCAVMHEYTPTPGDTT